MPNIIEEGTQEGLRLLGQQSQGLDLAAPTPDLPRQQPLPEDVTGLFGGYVASPAQRAQAKLLREKQNLQKLDKMFTISDKVISTSHTLEGDKRTQYLNKMLPHVERVYPGISKQIKTFAKDKSGYQDLLKQISDPKERAIFETLGRTGKFDDALKYAISLSLAKNRVKQPTVPQVTSPTKQERSQINRFAERNWPKDVPDLGEQQEDFIDILGSRAKEIARKKKINLDDALNEAWPQVYKENVAEGEIKERFGLDILARDEPTTLKAREEVQRIVEEYTQDNPAAPTTKEEFEKIPSGSWFINPSNKKILRKK